MSHLRLELFLGKTLPGSCLFGHGSVADPCFGVAEAGANEPEWERRRPAARSHALVLLSAHRSAAACTPFSCWHSLLVTMSSMRQVSGPSLASSPLLPQYDEDKTALLGTLTSDDEAYTPSLGNLPGALKQRRLFSRLPTPRHAAPLVCAIALLGTLAYFATSVGEFFAAQRDGLPHGRALARAFHHEPKWPLLEDGVAVLEAAEGQHTVTAIVLHGLGDVGDGKPFTWNMPSRFPWVRWSVCVPLHHVRQAVRDKHERRC